MVDVSRIEINSLHRNATAVQFAPRRARTHRA
jgi:hypothetical protein